MKLRTSIAITVALGAGSLFFEGDHFARVAMATGGNFVGNVMHFEQSRLALRFGDERLHGPALPYIDVYRCKGTPPTLP